jgi:predicted AAA+ superfamily ATPase
MSMGNKNMLILGSAGSGKSKLVRELVNTRNDVLLTAPSGIAALNINGEQYNRCLT